MKKIAMIVWAAIAAAGTLSAQQRSSELLFGGAVLNRDVLTPADMAALSATHPFGTARAMGMGGAFASLGADMTALSLNPAGLGMYRSSELSLTPLLTVGHTETPGTDVWSKNNRTQFAFANVGVAFNVLENSGRGLTSLTVGFGINRLADYNTRTSFRTESVFDPGAWNSPMPTIADLFGQQLGQAGVFPDKGAGGDPNGPLGYGNNPGMWPAILGYNGYMINVEEGPGGKLWVPSFIGRNASVTHGFETLESGSINEIALSVGGNINNILYFGATLGMQSIHRKTGLSYAEEYRYYDSNGVALDKNHDELISQLDYASLYQETRLDGVGVNVKLGLTLRPVAGLRLAVAYHTPTFYSLDVSYRAGIETGGYNNDTGDAQISEDRTPQWRDEDSESWDFVSPSRLLLGASYALGNVAVVSVDYERTWYNGMRMKNMPSIGISESDYDRSFRRDFRATNTVRAGLEVRPLPILALRLGGGYSTSMHEHPAQQINGPAPLESHYISAGVGVNLSRTVSLDLAYQNLTQKQSAYQLFFSADSRTGEFMTHSGFYETKLTRHYVALTLGVRF